MASSTMRIVTLGVVFAGACGLGTPTLRGQDPGGGVDGVVEASHVAPRSDDGARADHAFDRVTMVRELMKRRGGEPAAAAQLVQLVREFSPADAFAAFEDLAVAHERAGQLNLAAEARLMGVQAYPQEPAARAALLWLTRLYASCEVAHRYRPAGQETNAEADRGAALYAYQLAGSVPNEGGLSVSRKRGDEPALVFARAVAARRAGVPKAAGTLLATLKHAKAGEPWGDCARVEAWLEGGQSGEAPKSVVRCVRTVEAPRLDGVLDEACWAPVATVEVEEGVSAKPSAAADLRQAEPDVRWAWDGEYLYVAVRCPKAAGVTYPRDERGRTRDAALEAFDRVRLLVDVDRDYATGFELTVDSRGWTREACWGDIAWNPEWFVAAGEADGAWTAEAAIGLEQLGTKGMASGAAWAVGVERTLPESGEGERARPPAVSQTDTPGPKAFRVLIFE
jgi:hypothetical protein